MTMLIVFCLQGPESKKTEVACASNAGGGITTGGGFSWYTTAPSYQTSAIATYFTIAKNTSTTTPVSGYTATGRGYPDVSALAQNYLVVANNTLYEVSIQGKS